MMDVDKTGREDGSILEHWHTVKCVLHQGKRSWALSLILPVIVRAYFSGKQRARCSLAGFLLNKLTTSVNISETGTA